MRCDTAGETRRVSTQLAKKSRKGRNPCLSGQSRAGFVAFTARLKSCPFTKRTFASCLIGSLPSAILIGLLRAAREVRTCRNIEGETIIATAWLRLFARRSVP